jgi:hypothetical protein
MKRFIVVIGTSLLAVALPGAYASEDSEYERDGWSALERMQIERADANASKASAYDPERMPFEQTMLDRGAIGIAEPVLLAQLGGLSYKSGEESESPFATDHNFIAPAQ